MTPSEESTVRPLVIWLQDTRSWAVMAAVSLALGVLVLISMPDQPWIAAVLGFTGIGSVAGLFWAMSHGSGGRGGRLLALAADQDGQGILITDPQGGRIYANAAFAKMFSLAENEPDPLAAIALAVEAASAEAAEAGLEALMKLRGAAATARATLAEVPVNLGRGPVEWRRLQVRPLKGAEAPGAVLWRAEDVTAARALAHVQRDQVEKLADFLDCAPVGFFSADAEGHILYVNQTLAEWLGVGADELMRSRAGFAEFVVRAIPGPDDARGEVTLQAADGTIFPACLIQTAEEDEDGHPVFSRSVVVRDVTWRDAEADQAASGDPVSMLSGSQAGRWLFDDAPVGIALLDLDGGVIGCNRAFTKLLGVHREVVVGRPFTDRLSPEDRDPVGAQLSKIVLGTARAAHLEARMPGAGGREVVASLYASRLTDPMGDVSGIVLHFIDQTEQKHLEDQFAQSQKMQAVGQLAGGIAHDFNNLLTAMIGFSDLLLARLGPDDASFADVMQIKQNANRATNLVRQLLAFSRKQTLQPVVMDPAEAIRELSNLLGRLIGDNIELTIDHEDHTGHILADRGQFDQVIINLVVNARDAMPGGGAVAIRTSQLVLDAPVQRGHDLVPSGDYVLVEVSDTGHGISKENIGRIFEPFFSTKEVGAGTGLGLSTVYGIVRQSGGFIFVESEVGKGTTFSIYMPVNEEAQAEAAKAAAKGKASEDAQGTLDLTGAGTILLVEDEDAVRMFGSRALRNKGYTVLEAYNGENALDVINETQDSIDLIVSDIAMPGMDGLTLVRLVRQEFPNVKVILMSGYADDASLDDIEKDPTLHFLPKPFTLKDLAGKVKGLLDSD